MVGAGATTGGTMDLANLVKPILTEGEIRLIGSTTFEEFKHIEKDRALARRLQKIAVDEPNLGDTVQILQGLRSRYEEHHEVTYTDARPRGRGAPGPPAPARPPAARQRRGRDRRGGGGAAPATRPRTARRGGRRARRSSGSSRAWRASPRSRPRLREGAAAHPRGVAGARGVRPGGGGRTVASAIKRSRAGLGHPDHPAAASSSPAPPASGKTELAKQLARHLGNEFHRFDMSEYMEKHAVARLIGAPPGYVGFEQGGLLVDAVRQHPYSVVLLDEIEKAHPDLFNILLQVMDHATLTDNTGRKADFRQVVLIMTSNAGSREMSAGPSASPATAARTRRRRGKQALERSSAPSSATASTRSSPSSRSRPR